MVLLKEIITFWKNHIWPCLLLLNQIFYHECLYYHLRWSFVADWNHHLWIHRSHNESQTNEQYFIIRFRQTIIFINITSINILLPLFSMSTDISICFIPSTKEKFDENVQIKYNEIEYNSTFKEEGVNKCFWIYILYILVKIRLTCKATGWVKYLAKSTIQFFLYIYQWYI